MSIPTDIDQQIASAKKQLELLEATRRDFEEEKVRIAKNLEFLEYLANSKFDHQTPGIWKTTMTAICNLLVSINERLTSLEKEQELEVPVMNNTLRTLLDTCKANKNHYLDLTDIKMTILPVELKDYTWVKNLHISRCGLTSLDNLPPNVENLFASNNSLTKLPYIKYLISADFSANKISTIEKLPKKLNYIDLSYNQLKTIPEFHHGLQCMVLTGNYLSGNLILDDTRVIL